MAQKYRQYENNFPSVTQLIGQLRSPGLEYWFKIHTLKEINEISGRGKQIGTDTHLAIHHFIETGEAKIETQYPDEVTNALKSFMLFRKERQDIMLKNAEIALTSTKYLFNGKVDCLAEQEGKTIVCDWKSGDAKERDKPVIYDEAKFQVSAYVNLINEVQSQNIERAIIVAIAKDKITYNTYEMSKGEIDECFNEVFLSLLKIWKCRNKKEE